MRVSPFVGVIAFTITDDIYDGAEKIGRLSTFNDNQHLQFFFNHNNSAPLNGLFVEFLFKTSIIINSNSMRFIQPFEMQYTLGCVNCCECIEQGKINSQPHKQTHTHLIFIL